MRAAEDDADGEAPAGVDALVRRRLRCSGTVQGVGFRPAVYRLATSLGLAGEVRNDADGASIEIEGCGSAVAAFAARLERALPPLARLAGVDVTQLAPTSELGFRVDVSATEPRRRALIPADAMVCDDCRREIDDPSDRRHRYPFTTCTHCGPRFSLSRGLPYDRARTAMDRFALCPACRAEYRDPRDRRFHAEATCCPDCGPSLWLTAPDGAVQAEGQAALERAREALGAGGILAVKGLGGFQLACRADRAAPVARLRKSKRRHSKPFAVMARDLATARRVAVLGASDERVLCSPRSPILLAPRRQGSGVDASVAPGVGDVGVMLPTTPLHVELFRGAPYDLLVMTSGNLGEEPIARDNEEALARLAQLADLFLLHDRDVVRRVDDSLVRSAAAGVFVVRRSRGFAPEPLPLPVSAPEPVLALGGHLQTTACLAVGGEAFASQHVGDLDSESARAFLAEAAAGLEDFLEVEARAVALDLHPDYPSGWLGERWAAARGGRVIRVQHHLAHAAAVLAEHDAFPAPGERAAALVLDGTGWGPDGTAWGAEWLLLSGDLRWRRLAHGDALPLVGGERAVREPWRVAAAALALGGAAELLDRLPMAALLTPSLLETVFALAGRGDWPRATGAGRVFEAAGAMFGLALENGWEGECAARFEALAASERAAAGAWPEVELCEEDVDLPSVSLLLAAARRLVAGEAPPRVARGFHATFCQLAARLSTRVLPAGVARVALAGGCLVNRLLRQGLREEHEARGLRVLLPQRTPPGDGGLAYGQAVLAGVALARAVMPEFEGGR